MRLKGRKRSKHENVRLEIPVVFMVLATVEHQGVSYRNQPLGWFT